MKCKVLILLFACVFLAMISCQGKSAVGTDREFQPEQEVIYQDLERVFTQANFERLVNDRGIVFLLFLVDGSRELVNGVWRGGAGKLIFNDYRNGHKGFSIELSTSMFPVLQYSVDFIPEGVRVRYWSKDFLSSDERMTQAEIDKHSVYRLYGGILPKVQFLKVLKKRLLMQYRSDQKDFVEQNFYVMRVIEERKERPQGAM